VPVGIASLLLLLIYKRWKSKLGGLLPVSELSAAAATSEPLEKIMVRAE
jgi:hypothetical protein